MEDLEIACACTSDLGCPSLLMFDMDVPHCECWGVLHQEDMQLSQDLYFDRASLTKLRDYCNAVLAKPDATSDDE